MNRPIYDPTANRLLQDAVQVSDESGLSVIRSPHTNQWFVLDPWTWTSRRLESLGPDARLTVDETIRIEQVGAVLDESDWASDWLPRKPVEPSKAAGGIVIDESSRVLLRAPRGAYGGYVWTFPKGRIDQGETWPQAALREVEEETGWKCRIVVRVGTYRGDLTNTRFYLMRPVSKTGAPDQETEDIAWVRVERAVHLLNKTRTPRGRERDLTALRDALALHDQQFGTSLSVRVSWQLAKLIGWPPQDDAPTEATSRPTVRVLLPTALLCP
jgi:8-oxo-dGTP pyrophosphatase MutT (NUDIX family)